jgi:hypothetical protein
MAKRTSFSSELLIYSLILLLAIFFRFARLGETSLTEFEAQAALPAHSLAHGEAPDLGNQPGYVLFASPVFSLLGSSEFIARFLPALLGVALVFLPYFWRDMLGKKAALVLAFGLAIDPGMVAVSRLASGQMMAVSAGLIALTAWRQARPSLSGIFASIAFLASPLIFLGFIPAVLVAISLRQAGKPKPIPWQDFVVAATITLILAGTLFLRAPEGLGGIGGTLSAFIAGFGKPGVPLAEIGLALIGYVLPALVFGVIGGINSWRNNYSIGKVVSLFGVFSLLLILINPGRQIADLLWVVIALWILAAIQIAGDLSVPERDLTVALGELALMLLLGIFFTIALTKIAADYADFVWVAGATLILAILATVLIAFGWSRSGAVRGFVWSICLFSVLFLVSVSSRFQRVEISDANDLWAPGPAAGSDRLFADSLHDLSVLKQGVANDLAVESHVENAALAWELRDTQAATSETGGTSAVIITAAVDTQPEDLAAYRGQSFAISVQRAWSGWPDNFFAWLIYRQAPTETEQIILWARADLFPDTQLIGGPAPDQTP